MWSHTQGVSKKHVLSIGKADKRPELILFTGAIGTAYTKLYTPLLHQKDERKCAWGQDGYRFVRNA